MFRKSSFILSVGLALLIVMASLDGNASALPLSQNEGSPLADQTWVRLGGPIGGLGYDIRMRPDNPDIMYVTDAWAGVHKSEDGGQTWFTLNEGIDLRMGPSGDALPVFCLTIDSNNNDILWIGLQNLGAVYRSEDGGKTWEKRTNGIVESEGLTFRGISVEPGNSDVVYVAGEINSWVWAGELRWGREFDRVMGVVYKTTDGGETWKAVWRGNNLARYVLIHPEDPNILYLSTGLFDRESANSDPATNTAGGEGVLKSTDGGQTWTPINNGLRNLYVGTLAMNPKDPNILLAGTGNNAYREGGGVYLSTDGGENWAYKAAEQITSVEFALSDPAIAYAGGDGEFYRSEDGGNTWIPLMTGPNRWGWGPKGIRPGFPIDFQVDPRDPNRIFVNNYGGGNFLSEDGGKSWTVASNGYTGADLRDVAVYDENPAIVIVNGRSGPFISHDGGVNWTGVNPVELAPIAEGARGVFDPNDPDHILISSAHLGWTYESKDGGLTFKFATNYEEEMQNSGDGGPLSIFQGFQAITFAPSDPAIVYGGFSLDHCAHTPSDRVCNGEAKTIVSVLISEDGGATWTKITGTALDGFSVSEIVVHPTNPDIAWASTVGQGVYKTEDRGKTWNAINAGLTDLMVKDIAVDPLNVDVLYAATEQRGVFKTEDGGLAWKSSSAGMDPNEAVYTIIVDPARTNVVYAGGFHSGVYLSEDSGAHWRLINNGLVTRSVNAFAISADGETLYATTTGGGLFRLSAHDQAYFDSLAPTPMPTAILPAATVAPTSIPAITATSAPSDVTESSTPNRQALYIGAGLVVLAVILLILARRNKRR